MQHKHYYTETEAEHIKKRNKELMTKSAKKKHELRHRLEDMALAKELRLELDELK